MKSMLDMRIIVDAMGGDNAPKAPVLGAVEAARNQEVMITLIGREEAIRQVFREEKLEIPANITIVHADDVVDMHDDPAAVVRSRKDSSMIQGLKMLAEEKGDAFVSAGSTGALLTGATLVVKRVKGVRRAAMGPAIPNKKGGHTVICDCGANAECTPEFLLQFALMGSLYYREAYKKGEARVGLLNIGTEDSKGTSLQKEAYALLQNAHEQGLVNFIGNVEARDVPLGQVDVVVCDGFSGNVLLKSIEGTAMYMGSLLKHRVFKRNILGMIGYLFCKPGVNELMSMLDYRTIGGTQFLGIQKPVIKAHGASDSLAFRNAISQAAHAAQTNFSAELAESLKKLAPAKEAQA